MMSKIKWKLIFIQFQLANTVKAPWTSYYFVSLLSDIRDFQFLGPQIQSGKCGAAVMVNWVVLLARLDTCSFNVMVRAHVAQKGAFYIWVGNATNPNAWWFEKAAMGFVLCHIAVIFFICQIKRGNAHFDRHQAHSSHWNHWEAPQYAF